MIKHFSILLISIFIFFGSQAQETVKISGRVTDFDNNPIDSCAVYIKNNRFEAVYTAYTDKDGYYTMENVEKGKYTSMYALREKEYPRNNGVPEKDMRLEFWAWNIIADRDLTINPKYHKLELYGTTAFRIFGAYPGLFIYFRPMSVTKVIASTKDMYLDKAKMENENVDLSVDIEHIAVKVFANDEPLKVNSIQAINEYVGDNNSVGGYLVQVDSPKIRSESPYYIIKIEVENKEFDEFGENWYFYEIPNFKNKINEQ